MGELSARKANEVRKVASSRIIVCVSWREGGESVVWGAIKGEMLISGNCTGIEKVSSPCIAALLVCFTGGAKSLDNFIRGNNAKWSGRFIRMSSRGSVRQIEENVSSNDKFRGGEIDTRTARRRGKWSKESIESGHSSEGAKLVSRSTDKTGKIRKERSDKKIDKERCPVKGSVPDTLWTDGYKAW